MTIKNENLYVCYNDSVGINEFSVWAKITEYNKMGVYVKRSLKFGELPLNKKPVFISNDMFTHYYHKASESEVLYYHGKD